jgi:carboxyl-terminal processing protease
MKTLRLVMLLAVGVGLGVALQAAAGRAQKPKDDTFELYGTFVDAVEQVEANYVRQVSRRELIEAALQGMLQSLDPNSSFFNDSEWRQFQRQFEGSFTGIGVQLDTHAPTGRLMVVAPLVGSPAYRAGVLGGDVILEVDGKSTEGWDQRKATEAIGGRPGTDVELKIVHRGQDEPVTVKVTRSPIELDSVLGDRRKADDDSWDFLIDPESKIGYVRVNTFDTDTTPDLRKALDELVSAGMKGLVLDLRDDPGGMLSTAVEVANMFLDSGTIVSTRGRNVRARDYLAEKDKRVTDVPMAVLINGSSASASEIVASALQDHKRAAIVGSRSFGKGSVQNIIGIDDGDSKLRLTVAEYRRPSGRKIHRYKTDKPSDEWGVTPDEGLVVEMTPEQYRDWAITRQKRDMISKANPSEDPDLADPLKTDPQLAKALEVVKSKLGGAG